MDHERTEITRALKKKSIVFIRQPATKKHRTRAGHVLLKNVTIEDGRLGQAEVDAANTDRKRDQRQPLEYDTPVNSYVINEQQTIDNA